MVTTLFVKVLFIGFLTAQYDMLYFRYYDLLKHFTSRDCWFKFYGLLCFKIFHLWLVLYKVNKSKITLTIIVLLTLSLVSASFLRNKINYFSLKMHKIWHISFCITILTRKLKKILLLKLSYKNSWVKFDAFSRRNGSFFPSKTRRCEAKLLN